MLKFNQGNIDSLSVPIAIKHIEFQFKKNQRYTMYSLYIVVKHCCLKCILSTLLLLLVVLHSLVLLTVADPLEDKQSRTYKTGKTHFSEGCAQR